MYILPIVGFGSAGVTACSIAAGVQSIVYGAIVPAGSVFAGLQGLGATGAAAGTLGMAAAPISIVAAGGAYAAVKAIGG